MSSPPLSSYLHHDVELCKHRPQLHEIDECTRRVLQRFVEPSVRPVDTRLLQAIRGDDERAHTVLQVHNEGLIREIEDHMDLLNRMQTLQKLSTAFGELSRRASVYSDNVRLRKQVANLRMERDHLHGELDTAKQRMSQLEANSLVLRSQKNGLTDKLATLQQKLDKEKKSHEATRLELCVHQNAKVKTSEPTCEVRTPDRDPRPDFESLMKLSMYCHDATKNWIQQTEENNWAARVIHRLSRSLTETQGKLWDVLVAVSESFGHVTWLTEPQRARFTDMGYDEDAALEITLWGKKLSRSDLVTQQALKVRFHSRSFTSLSSFLVNYSDYVVEGSGFDPVEMEEFLHLQRILGDQVKDMMGVTPSSPGETLAKMMLAPVRRAMRRWEEKRPFHADVFRNNLTRWNVIDSLSYQTTGDRSQVFRMWLGNLLSSAATAVTGRNVWFIPIALMYNYKATSTSPSVKYSYYRVGLSFTPPRGQTAVTSWLPISFTSFENVLHILEYLEDYLDDDLQFVVRGKQIVTDNATVKLKRMRGANVVRDPEFGDECDLVFPTKEWLREAALLYTRYPIQDLSCYTQSEETGCCGFLTGGNLMHPRCDNHLVRSVALTNFTYNASPIEVTGNGSTKQKYLANCHLKYIHRKYLMSSVCDLVSDEDLVTFATHFGAYC